MSQGRSVGLRPQTWLISGPIDLTAFLLPAVVSLGLFWAEPLIAPSGETPLPIWVIAVLLVDVTHVWATALRTYFDPLELARRTKLYIGVPVAAYLAGVILHHLSSALFWRVLAYVAVIHFVRQQWGWVALYNRKAGDTGTLERRLDQAAVYSATLFPLLWWHTHLPRDYAWFMEGDFVTGLPSPVADLAWPLYAFAFLVFAARQLFRLVREKVLRAGKVIVVFSTFACWGLGIIVANTDYRFTVTNVLIHGAPYLVLITFYGRSAHHPGRSALFWLHRGPGLLVLAILLSALAFSEELLWDRLVWDERPTFFLDLPSIIVGAAGKSWLVPLLALPQAAHYILDAFIWRTDPQQNPDLARIFGLRGAG